MRREHRIYKGVCIVSYGLKDRAGRDLVDSLPESLRVWLKRVECSGPPHFTLVSMQWGGAHMSPEYLTASALDIWMSSRGVHDWIPATELCVQTVVGAKN
jgi:hypothetical protein